VLSSLGMGNIWHVSEPSRYATSHPGRLNLAILLWVGAVCASKC